MGGRWDIEGMGRGEESTGSKCDGDVTYTCETVKEHIKIKKLKIEYHTVYQPHYSAQM